MKINVLPPGTLLQLMHLRERLEKLEPGRFIEIGPGSGEISKLLLDLGWGGVSYDLESRTVERLRRRFSEEISERRYETKNENFLALTGSTNKVDLIISCMVMEHLNDDLERQFMWQSLQLLNDEGLMIGLVPASPPHWGIEDDIAGHCRRYTRDRLHSLVENNGWKICHLSGLTYPVSNTLLPLSNFLVLRAEKSKLALSTIEKTKASGIRNVSFKTTFPTIFSVVLNSYTLLPFYWLQKLFSASHRSLVLYFEATPQKQGMKSEY